MHHPQLPPQHHSSRPQTPIGNIVPKLSYVSRSPTPVGRIVRPMRQRGDLQIQLPKPDISPELLQSLKKLTKKDFEHATAEVESKPEIAKSINNYIPPPGPRTHPRKSNPTEGFNFFIQQPSGAAIMRTGGYSRPMTVPRFNIQTSMANCSNGKTIRPVTASSSSNCEGRSRPAKCKVIPASYESDLDEHERPLTVTCSESEESITESDRPSSACSVKRVTFAPSVVNYERESKPSKKRKIPKRRKQGFPHPSRGIFIPPSNEIVASIGPEAMCKENQYLTFSQVWTHPISRSSPESNSTLVIRQERFHKLMGDLEHAHVHYNRLTNLKQNDYLTQCIFKRYILVLDLALTEGHLNQVEHLLETISKSIPVLHQNTFYYLYGSRIIRDDHPIHGQGEKSLNLSESNSDLLLANYALSRISGTRSRLDCTQMCIETVLVKLCLELIEVVYSPFGSMTYRNALNTLPHTVKQAILLLKSLKEGNDGYSYVRWINNSAVQRDFRSILKNFGLLDKFGSKSEFPVPPAPPPAVGEKNKVKKAIVVSTSGGRHTSPNRPRLSTSPTPRAKTS